jgi:hypothetical protein
MLAAAKPGSTVTLDRQSYGVRVQGPVVIRQDVTLDGQGATLWAAKGPVLVVESGKVVLKNVGFEPTGSGDGAQGLDDCSIQVMPAGEVTGENVDVRGAVVGMAGEEGRWDLPYVVRMGRIAHHQDATMTVRVVVGAACRAESRVEGLHVSPETLSPGEQEITLRIDADTIRKETLLYGPVQFVTEVMRRKMIATGFVVDAAADHKQPSGVIWEPAGWGKPLAKPVSLDEPEGEEVEQHRAKAQDGDEASQNWLLERGFAW